MRKSFDNNTEYLYAAGISDKGNWTMMSSYSQVGKKLIYVDPKWALRKTQEYIDWASNSDKSPEIRVYSYNEELSDEINAKLHYGDKKK